MIDQDSLIEALQNLAKSQTLTPNPDDLRSLEAKNMLIFILISKIRKGFDIENPANLASWEIKLLKEIGYYKDVL